MADPHSLASLAKGRQQDRLEDVSVFEYVFGFYIPGLDVGCGKLIKVTVIF